MQCNHNKRLMQCVKASSDLTLDTETWDKSMEKIDLDILSGLVSLFSTIRYDFDQYWFPPSSVHGYTKMMMMNSCRGRFHVNLICFFFQRKFQFLCLSLSLWKWINEEMKTEREIQRIKTQSRYRWTKNSDKQCHVPSSFRERIENSWKIQRFLDMTLWYENKNQFYGSTYCLPHSLADGMCFSVQMTNRQEIRFSNLPRRSRQIWQIVIDLVDWSDM